MGLYEDDGNTDNWSKIQASGISRTLDKHQHQALIEWLDRQIAGGVTVSGTWGPRYWKMVGWAKPETNGSLSHHMRVRLVLWKADDGAPVGKKITIVWVNTVRWQKIK